MFLCACVCACMRVCSSARVCVWSCIVSRTLSVNSVRLSLNVAFTYVLSGSIQPEKTARMTKTTIRWIYPSAQNPQKVGLFCQWGLLSTTSTCWSFSCHWKGKHPKSMTAIDFLSNVISREMTKLALFWQKCYQEINWLIMDGLVWLEGCQVLHLLTYTC